MSGRIGILGGTFDPVHCAHMLIARTALEQYGLNEVWLMTGGNPPHKRGSDVTSARTRHEMVILAAEGERGLVPFDYEVNKTTYSYTAETLTELTEKYPDTEFYFIIGEDSLRDFGKWHRPEVIARCCVLLVYPRAKGSELWKLVSETAKRFDADIRALNAPLLEISSTMIRQRAAQGRSVRYLVPDKVEKYIRENNLYGQ